MKVSDHPLRQNKNRRAHTAMQKMMGLLGLLLMTTTAWSQTAVIKGKVTDQSSNEPLPFANVVIKSLEKGATTNEDGTFRLEVSPGLYNLSASFVGYQSQTRFEVQATTAMPTTVNFALEASASQLETVEVSAQQQFTREKTSPVSVSSLGIN
ncbi:MAG: carboxypeptidase-like regulatory domain-containing protein, partial [Schleiferiaceae bacterium]|nr:carboxypeptidase-like regulatory domain-containing protein [Schleiferiaceae bacterium]